MGHNLKDLESSIPGLIYIAVILGLTVWKNHDPADAGAIVASISAIGVIAGGHLLFGARSGKDDPDNG